MANVNKSIPSVIVDIDEMIKRGIVVDARDVCTSYEQRENGEPVLGSEKLAILRKELGQVLIFRDGHKGTTYEIEIGDGVNVYVKSINYENKRYFRRVNSADYAVGEGKHYKKNQVLCDCMNRMAGAHSEAAIPVLIKDVAKLAQIISDVAHEKIIGETCKKQNEEQRNKRINSGYDILFRGAKEAENHTHGEPQKLEHVKNPSMFQRIKNFICK